MTAAPLGPVGDVGEPPAPPSNGAVPANHLPASFGYQVREGIHNQVITFELPVYRTGPAKNPDASFEHEVDIRDLILASARAQRKLIEELRAKPDTNDAAFAAANERWFFDLAEWTVAL